MNYQQTGFLWLWLLSSTVVMAQTSTFTADMPHMHKLGRRVKAFAITPDGDAINLIRINDWDYNWQLTYFFREPLVLPKGSTIIAEANYDNTDQNPLNPNRPAEPLATAGVRPMR